MRLACLASLLFVVSGCLDSPPFAAANITPDAAIPALCDNCEFPPDWADDNGLALKTAVSADIDGNPLEDLIVANGPDNPNYWGFFLIQDLPNQTGSVVAQTFVTTDVRPLAATVDRFQNFSRVYLIGEPVGGEAFSLRVYQFDSTGSVFVPRVDENVDMAEDLDLDEIDAPQIAVGEFNDSLESEKRDVIVADEDTIFFRFCQGAATCPAVFQELAPVPTDEVLEVPNSIRGIERRVSQLVPDSTFRSLERQGIHDLFVAGQGEVRYFTYSRDTSSNDIEWVSLQEIADVDENGPGVMGSMTNSAGADFEADQPYPDSVFAGVGQLDIMTFIDNSGGGGGVIEPETRFRFLQADPILDPGTGDADKVAVLATAVVPQPGLEPPTMVFLGKSQNQAAPTLHAMRSVTFDIGAERWDATPFSRVLSTAPTNLLAFPQESGTIFEMFLFQPNGNCECIAFDTQVANPDFVQCAGGRTCTPR